MRVQRFWEKAVRGDHARWSYLVSREYPGTVTGRKFTMRGYGNTLAEAKADLQCQMIRCAPAHNKIHQPTEVWTISR